MEISLRGRVCFGCIQGLRKWLSDAVADSLGPLCNGFRTKFAYSLTSISIFSDGKPQKCCSFPRITSVQNHLCILEKCIFLFLGGIVSLINNHKPFRRRIERKLLDIPIATRSSLLFVHISCLWIRSGLRIKWEAMILYCRAKPFSFHQIYIFSYIYNRRLHLWIFWC